MKILVTGGAGYIGSHAVKLLTSVHDVTVFDNLSTGNAWAVLGGARLVVGDLDDDKTLSSLFDQGNFDAVMHFAASIVVPESVKDPLKYYANNTCNMLNLLEQVARCGVRYFVFSSTAAVYGIPPTATVSEDTPLAPINPYGASKMMSERILGDFAAAEALKYVALRYFNVAGADPRARIGQATPNATHLIKVACETALGRRPGMDIYGTDYPTADGTCIRDYIHVEDLAEAHVLALNHLAGGSRNEVMNCGYGHGFSVREVLAAVERVAGCTLTVSEGPRRAGDPPALVADSRRIRAAFDWRPRYDDLDQIVRHALAWERVNPVTSK